MPFYPADVGGLAGKAIANSGNQNEVLAFLDTASNIVGLYTDYVQASIRLLN